MTSPHRGFPGEILFRSKWFSCGKSHYNSRPVSAAQLPLNLTIGSSMWPWSQECKVGRVMNTSFLLNKLRAALEYLYVCNKVRYIRNVTVLKCVILCSSELIQYKDWFILHCITIMELTNPSKPEGQYKKVQPTLPLKRRRQQLEHFWSRGMTYCICLHDPLLH